jgi:L-ascorbate metabolism protein UlaG (beta-lactamase superfamily)
MRVTLIGHATVLVELDGIRILTDPLLRRRVGVVLTSSRREGALAGELDAVLVSHFHRDHLDPASLALLEPDTTIVGPPGLARRLRRLPNPVTEVEPGESVAIGPVTARATPARHGRLPARFQPVTLGFVLLGSERIYFAGDTDLFPELADLAHDNLDVALLPVGGWGPRLGAGHLDPRRAAEAVRRIRPRIAVPIHWGFLRPLGVGFLNPRYLTDAGPAFARLVGEIAPEVEVRVLAPGETLET